MPKAYVEARIESTGIDEFDTVKLIMQVISRLSDDQQKRDVLDHCRNRIHVYKPADYRFISQEEVEAETKIRDTKQDGGGE